MGSRLQGLPIGYIHFAMPWLMNQAWLTDRAHKELTFTELLCCWAPIAGGQPPKWRLQGTWVVHTWCIAPTNNDCLWDGPWRDSLKVLILYQKRRKKNLVDLGYMKTEYPLTNRSCCYVHISYWSSPVVQHPILHHDKATSQTNDHRFLNNGRP